MRANRSKLFNVRREGIKINSALDTINLHPINEKSTSPLRKEQRHYNENISQVCNYAEYFLRDCGVERLVVPSEPSVRIVDRKVATRFCLPRVQPCIPRTHHRMPQLYTQPGDFLPVRIPQLTAKTN